MKYKDVLRVMDKMTGVTSPEYKVMRNAWDIQAINQSEISKDAWCHNFTLRHAVKRAGYPTTESLMEAEDSIVIDWGVPNAIGQSSIDSITKEITRVVQNSLKENQLFMPLRFTLNIYTGSNQKPSTYNRLVIIQKH